MVDNAICLALELCEGDLEDFLRRRPEQMLTDDQAITVLWQMSSGLRYMRNHGPHGIVHRDLKPANILLRSTDPLEVAISDFALSKIIL